MNRTDRLLAIVLELQRRRRSHCRAEDLATHFEVSKRTIYRDIQALCEAGEPIQTERVVEPHQLTRLANDWYLTSYCHLRQATRVFRLARIDQVTVLDRTFDPAEHLVDQPGQCTSEPLFVQVLFHAEMARQVREPPQCMLLEKEETAEGMQMTLLAQSDQDIVRWLLSWGGDVRVDVLAWDPLPE